MTDYIYVNNTIEWKNLAEKQPPDDRMLLFFLPNFNLYEVGIFSKENWEAYKDFPLYRPIVFWYEFPYLQVKPELGMKIINKVPEEPSEMNIYDDGEKTAPDTCTEKKESEL